MDLATCAACGLETPELDRHVIRHGFETPANLEGVLDPPSESKRRRQAEAVEGATRHLSFATEHGLRIARADGNRDGYL